MAFSFQQQSWIRALTLVTTIKSQSNITFNTFSSYPTNISADVTNRLILKKFRNTSVVHSELLLVYDERTNIANQKIMYRSELHVEYRLIY